MKTITEPTLSSESEMHRSAVHSLNEHGYGYVSFTPPCGLIERVMKGWNDFLLLPRDVRIAWRCGDPADWDDGYVPREPNKGCPGCDGCASSQEGVVYDNKHFFHYRPHLVALLDHKQVDYTLFISWLEALHELYGFCRSTFYEMLLELDEYYYPELCCARRFSSFVAETRHTLRLLSYNEPMQPGQVLGKAHVDRNFGTIQVHESHPALVLNLREGRRNYLPRQHHVLMFTGAKAAALTKCRLPGINHAIIVPDDFVSQAITVPRQSIVFFGHISPETL